MPSLLQQQLLPMTKLLSIATAVALAGTVFVQTASAQRLTNNRLFKDALEQRVGTRTGNAAINAANRVLIKGVRDTRGARIVPYTRLAFRAMSTLSRSLSARQQYVAVQNFLNRAVRIYVQRNGVDGLLLRNIRRGVAQIPRPQRTMANIMRIADQLVVINRFGTVEGRQDLVNAAYQGSGFPPPTVS